MEIRIGIKQSPRELSFESNASADEVRGNIEKAVHEDAKLVTLSDVKGRQYLIDPSSIAYVELGGEAGRKVGFIS